MAANFPAAAPTEQVAELVDLEEVQMAVALERLGDLRHRRLRQ